MKNNIDKRLLSEELLILLFKKSSVDEILRAVSEDTINELCEIYDISTDGDVQDKLIAVSNKVPKHSQVLNSFCKTHIFDNISASLRQIGSAVLFQLVYNGKVIWTADMGLLRYHEYEIVNLGSGRDDNGKYYLSIGVRRDLQQWASISLLVDYGKVEIVRRNPWAIIIPKSQLVFDETICGFVEQPYRDSIMCIMDKGVD